MSTDVRTPVERLLYTPAEAARALAVSSRTLWTLTKRGEVGSIRIGRLVRYDVEDLKAWIASHKTARANSARVP